MEDLENVYVTDYIPTIYTTPCELHYSQKGRKKVFPLLAERNGVLVIVYNKSLDRLTLVKQFRPSVYLSCIPKSEREGLINTEKYPPSLGITLEFCAGLEDKNIPSEVIAREEVLEECGYDVPAENLQRICSFPNMNEYTGARSILFYCEVSEEMRVGQGGGVDDEIIDVVELPVEKVVEYARKDIVNSPSNFLFGLYWFLYNKYEKQL